MNKMILISVSNATYGNVYLISIFKNYHLFLIHIFVIINYLFNYIFGYISQYNILSKLYSLYSLFIIIIRLGCVELQVSQLTRLWVWDQLKYLYRLWHITDLFLFVFIPHTRNTLHTTSYPSLQTAEQYFFNS